MEAPVVSLHAAVLYAEDVALLAHPTAWLNDAAITFWWEHLAHVRFAGHAAGGGAADELVSLVHPAAVALALFEDDDADRAAALRPLRLGDPRRRLVVLPVNDNDDPARVAGGSHWSLLACTRSAAAPGGEWAATHYDSGATDPALVRRVLRRFWPLLAESSSAVPPPPPVVDGGCAKQADAHSCGVYVCALAEQLVVAVLGAGGSSDARPAAGELTPADVAAYRRGMAATALALAAEQRRAAPPSSREPKR
jgi:hypothetical protein